MSKLKLKKIKEQDKNRNEQSLKDMKNLINPVNSLQHLFVDKPPSERGEPKKQSTIEYVSKTDNETSKYFITSSLPDQSTRFDDSDVEFQPEKISKRKAVIPQKEAKTNNRPSRKRLQKDIRDVMNSRNDDLMKYTQRFEKECASAGVDVNPEHLQLAIALSHSITDFQNDDVQNNDIFNNRNTPMELTPRQEKMFEQNRIKQIRKTLDEFGFKIQRASSSVNVKSDVKRKQTKNICTNFPLLSRSQAEKSQRISDILSQILFKSIPHIDDYTKSSDNIPGSIYLNEILCDCSCLFSKSCLSYEDIKDKNIYYTSDLLEPSTSDIGCLLKDWNSIPGREKSPLRNNHLLSDFRESKIYFNSFDTLLSGTFSMISSHSNVGAPSHLKKLENCHVINIDFQSNSRIYPEENLISVTRCSSPDIFGDDSFTNGILQIDNQTVKDSAAIVVNDSSDDDLPRIYISRSQKESPKTLSSISQCEYDVYLSTHVENYNKECDVLDFKILHKSVDLTQDDSEKSLVSKCIDNITNSHEDRLDITNYAVTISEDSISKTQDKFFDQIQGDSENNLSQTNHSAIAKIIENHIDRSDLCKKKLDEISDNRFQSQLFDLIRDNFIDINGRAVYNLDMLKVDEDKEISLDVENIESILDTSENLDTSHVYEGRNGIIHYESFQTSPVNSIRKLHTSYNDSLFIRNSSDNSNDDMFQRSREYTVGNNLKTGSMYHINDSLSSEDMLSCNGCKKKLLTTLEEVDLTQSSKDSDTQVSASHSAGNIEVKRHVCCQSMLVGHGSNVNSTINYSMSSIDSNEIVKYYEDFVQKSQQQDITMSSHRNCSNLSVPYSAVNIEHVNSQSILTSKNISPVINMTMNSCVSSIDKTQKELSNDSSTSNDVFIISDEEFNYSMSTPYNKKDKRLLKKVTKHQSYVKKKNTQCKTVKRSDLFENKNEPPFHRSRESNEKITDSPVYNLKLCGSSLFEQIPSCDSSFSGNLVKNNIGGITNEHHIEFTAPSTSKNTTPINIHNEYEFDVNKQNLKQNSCNVLLDYNRISAILGTVTPNNNKYLIETDNVTPTQDFNIMDTPEMLKELSKFGLKPLKRKRAVQLLEHIYNETHPILPMKLPQKKRLKFGDNFSASTPSQHAPIMSDFQQENFDKHTERENLSQNISGQMNTAEKSFESLKKNDAVLDDVYSIYLQDCEKITIKHNLDCDPVDWKFQNKEKTKVHGCRVPLHIAFHNYLSLRSKLRDAILRYEPVNIDTIYRGLIAEGSRYNIKDLFHFMDKKCITIKTTDKNIVARQHKKKRC